MIIGLDMGHTVSGANYGAVGIIKESEETRRLGKEVKCLLQNQGHTVIDCTIDRASSNSDSINRRVKRANAQRLDLFISLHFNDSKNPASNGVEVLTYNANKLIEAQRVLENIESIGFRNRGIKTALTYRGDKVAVVHNTKAKSMLIEVCFVSNLDDTNRYKANIDKVAAAIAEGITGQKLYSNLSLKADKNSPIASAMQEEIKLLQKVCNLKQDGIATEELVSKLPILTGVEQRGCVTVMQRILIMKGFLSSGSATGIIGPANKNALSKFKESVGIPVGGALIDKQTWKKLIEY